MATDSFPSDPNRRRTILILSQNDIERCEYEEGSAKLLDDDEIHVLRYPIPEQKETPIAIKNIIGIGAYRPGSILVQSPYDTDVYESFDLALQRFSLDKHMYFSTLCMHLGAKAVSVEQVSITEGSRKYSLDAGGEYKGIDVQVSGAREELDQLREKINLHDEYAGGEPDIDSAEKLLHRYQLWSDTAMRSLIEARRAERNPIKARNLTLNLSSETKRNLKIAGRSQVPALARLDANFNSSHEIKKELILTLSVKF